MLETYPDYGKAPAPYLITVTETLAALPEDIVAAMLDLTTGIRSKCAFLPTVADLCNFAVEYRQKREQFKPIRRAPEHKLLPRDNSPEPTADERQRAKNLWEKAKAEMTEKRLAEIETRQAEIGLGEDNREPPEVKTYRRRKKFITGPDGKPIQIRGTRTGKELLELSLQYKREKNPWADPNDPVYLTEEEIRPYPARRRDLPF